MNEQTEIQTENASISVTMQRTRCRYS